MSKLKPSMIVPQDILDFYCELNNVHNKYGDEVRASIDRDTQEAALEQGAPILNITGFGPEPEKLKEAVKEVIGVIRFHRPQFEQKLSEIEKALETKEKLLWLADKYIWQDFRNIEEFVDEKGLESDLLSLVLFNAVKPFAAGYAKGIKGEFSMNIWGKNFCPVCGWNPNMSIVKADTGERVLQCSMCDTEWKFKNLKCPHCFNEDHDTLGYFTIEDDNVYRVNGCKKCGGYIKTVNEKELISKENAFLTDIKTLHLDILAEREGFKRVTDSLPDKELN